MTKEGAKNWQDKEEEIRGIAAQFKPSIQYADADVAHPDVPVIPSQPDALVEPKVSPEASEVWEFLEKDLDQAEKMLIKKAKKGEMTEVPELTAAHFEKSKMDMLDAENTKKFLERLEKIQKTVADAIETRKKAPPRLTGEAKRLERSAASLRLLQKSLEELKSRIISEVSEGKRTELIPAPPTKAFMDQFDEKNLNGLNKDDRETFVKACKAAIEEVNISIESKREQAGAEALESLLRDIAEAKRHLLGEMEADRFSEELPTSGTVPFAQRFSEEKVALLGKKERGVFMKACTAAAAEINSVTRDRVEQSKRTLELLRAELPGIKAALVREKLEGVVESVAETEIQNRLDQELFARLRMSERKELAKEMGDLRQELQAAFGDTGGEDAKNEEGEKKYLALRAQAEKDGTDQRIMGSLSLGLSVLKKATPEIVGRKEEFWEPIKEELRAKSDRLFKIAQKDFGWTDKDLEVFSNGFIREAFDKYL